jgi:hypothetical protein
MNKQTKTCTFDYDGTLSEKKVQKYAKKLLERGIDVWVVTRRHDDLYLHHNENESYDNTDLFAVVDELGIPRWKVKFTCMNWKAEYLHPTNVIWHLDDDDNELVRINNPNVKIVGIDVKLPNWMEECEKLINND